MREKFVKNSKWLLIMALAFLMLLGFSKDAEAAVSPSVTAASITAAGISTGKVRVKATISSKVKSKDGYYYLFEVNPCNDKLYKKIASMKKASVVRFDLNTRKNAAYPIMKYALAVKTGKGTSKSAYTRISPAVYVRNPQKAAIYRSAYKYPKTKKGLQSANLSEQVETGSKNCFVNLYVSTVANGGGAAFKYDGKTYYFDELWGYRSLVSSCNSKGISVTMQIMLDEAAPDDLKASPGGGALYAFNIYKSKAQMKMNAIFAYLAKTFGTNNCYVSNWILGNEVNSCSAYWYMGDVSEDEFVWNYATCFRSLYNAVRSVRGSSKVFICLEHCWTMPNAMACAFPGKSVLQKFNSTLKLLQKGVQWNLAYHAYPADLRVPSFWNDGVSQSADSAIISPRNLRSLTSYIRNTYGQKTRVIISEIGFNSMGVGQTTQAAGLALAYDIAACDPMVDAFIVRAYHDEEGDMAHGVAFGIKGKKAFTVFKYMDTTKYLSKTQNILTKAVGSNWQNYVPGYKPGRIYSMYKK